MLNYNQPERGDAAMSEQKYENPIEQMLRKLCQPQQSGLAEASPEELESRGPVDMKALEQRGNWCLEALVTIGIPEN